MREMYWRSWSSWFETGETSVLHRIAGDAAFDHTYLLRGAVAVQHFLSIVVFHPGLVTENFIVRSLE